jgi:hypothetical protein
LVVEFRDSGSNEAENHAKPSGLLDSHPANAQSAVFLRPTRGTLLKEAARTDVGRHAGQRIAWAVSDQLGRGQVSRASAARRRCRERLALDEAGPITRWIREECKMDEAGDLGCRDKYAAAVAYNAIESEL